MPPLFLPLSPSASFWYLSTEIDAVPEFLSSSSSSSLSFCFSSLFFSFFGPHCDSGMFASQLLAILSPLSCNFVFLCLTQKFTYNSINTNQIFEFLSLTEKRSFITLCLLWINQTEKRRNGENEKKKCLSYGIVIHNLISVFFSSHFLTTMLCGNEIGVFRR